MKEAGWISSNGEAQESPPVFIPDSEEAPVPQSEGDEIVRGEIPDWIREIAPSGVLEPEAPFMESADEETVLPWLEETPPSPSDSVATWLSEVQPEPAPEYEEIKPVEQEAEAEGLPDWLKPLAATGVGITAGALAAKEIEPEEQQPGEEAVETPVEALPVPGFTPPIEPVKPTEPVEPVESAESAEEVPDWIKVMMAEESLPAIPVTPPVEVETPVVEPPQEIIVPPPPELPVEEPPSAASA